VEVEMSCGAFAIATMILFPEWRQLLSYSLVWRASDEGSGSHNLTVRRHWVTEVVLLRVMVPWHQVTFHLLESYLKDW
jgi:hypothetical protein